ncbi:MAG: hypothetical protein ACLPH3_17775 [Terracidiphilus sp.]
MKLSYLVFLALLASAVPAVANVTVNSPGENAKVVSPFWLSATASPCSSQPIAAMGYSFDNSTNTNIVYSSSLSAVIGFATGAHVLHIKSWGNQGAPCVTSINLTVVPPPTAAIPLYAIEATEIQTLGNWLAADDIATGSGLSSGIMRLVSSPSLSGYAREFTVTYSNSSGERFDVPFGVDTESTNFLYDAWIDIAGASNNIANLEMDLNQVMPNGQTVIFGFQCDGYSGTWDYTVNAGSPQNPSDIWRHSYSECNPREWSTNTWHHIQISYSRDGSGNVTYQSVWLDNIESDLYITVPSAFALGWEPTLLTNFQIDGLGASGSATVYLDNLTIYRW